MTDPRGRTPRVPAGLIDRPQVHELLSCEAQVVVLRAPAGFGKTTALLQWLHQSDTPAAWVELTHAARSRDVVWRRVLAAVESALTRGGADAASGDVVTAADAPEHLIDRLRTAPSLMLVIDGAHLVEEAAIFDDLVRVLRRVPSLRLAVTTRAPLSLLGPRVAARLDVQEIDPTALQLQQSEVQTLTERAGVTASAAVISSLTQAADGSILAARMLVLTLSRTTTKPDDPLMVSLAAVGEEFCAEFLADTQVDAALTDFMLRTATARTLPVELARQLCPTVEVERLLQQVREAGGGMGGHDEPSGVFVYHPLLKAGLQARLRRSHPEEFRRLRLLVARWELDHDGDAFAAFDIAIEEADLALATEIARRTWLDILRFHVPGIIRAGNHVSIWRLQNHPVLATLMAAAHNTRPDGRFSALEYFATATLGTRLHHKSLPAADRIILATMLGSALRVSGKVNRALTSTVEAMGLIERADQDTHQALGDLRPALLANIGVTYLTHLRYPEATRAFELAASAAAESDRPRAPLHPLALRAGTAALEGNLPHAARLIVFPDADAWPAAERGTYLATFYHVARTVLFLEQLDTSAASTELDLLEGELPTNEHRGLLLRLRALCIAGAGEPLKAAHLLLHFTTTEQSLRRLTPSAIAQARAMAAAMLSLAGNQEDAAAVLRSIPRRWRSHTHSKAALVALHHNDLDQAAEHLQLAALVEKTVRARAEQGLMHAVLHWRQGRPERAHDHLIAATTILSDTGMRLPALFLPSRDLQQLQQAFPDLSTAGLLTPLPNLPHANTARVRLTPREHLVLTHLTENLTAAQIASKLFVSVHTVKSQMNSAYRKLGARTREEAVENARRLGVLD